MDGSRFDNLARSLAGRGSRRSLLRGLAGLAGGLLGAQGVAAGSCREAGRLCNADADCCVGFCDTANPDPTRRNRCACPAGTFECRGGCKPAGEFQADPVNCGGCGTRCPAPANATSSCASGICTFTCVTGYTRAGTACVRNGCQIGGAAVAANAINPANPCQVCLPATSTTAWSILANGTACDDGNACTRSDTCQAGTCIGTDPVVCTASDQCHVAGTCNPSTGTCSNPNAQNGTPCNDANACTTGDSCQSGVCSGGTPRVCTPSSPCVTVTCDAIEGCVEAPKALGAACGDANACNGNEACNGEGTCVPGTPVTCPAPGPCQEGGVCDPTTGACAYANKADGLPCDTGNLCTADTCLAGACVTGPDSVTPTCTASDQCHDAGVCDPTTGDCTNPDTADDTACDDANACTQTDTCQAGVCTGSDPVVCPTPTLSCQDPGLCDPTSGLCTTPVTPGFCLIGDACVAAGTPNPLNPCQVCDPTRDPTAWSLAANGAPCATGNICQEHEVCTEGHCGGGTAVNCDDGNPCSTDSCTVTIGCVHVFPSPTPVNECTVSMCVPRTADTLEWVDVPTGACLECAGQEGDGCEPADNACCGGLVCTTDPDGLVDPTCQPPCGVSGDCLPAGGCGHYVLAGAGGGEGRLTEPIYVHHDLTVTLNGDIIFDSRGQPTGTLIPPIAFAAAAGNTLTVMATNLFGGCHLLDPVGLFCADNSISQPIHPGIISECTDPDTGRAYLPSDDPFFTATVVIDI